MRIGRVVTGNARAMGFRMTRKAVRDVTEFPALVVAAFFVRNAAVLIGLSIFVLIALARN